MQIEKSDITDSDGLSENLNFPSPPFASLKSALDPAPAF
jgi:hypothetical protein